MRKSVLWTLVCMAVLAGMFAMGPVKAEAGYLENWEFVYKHDASGNAVSGSYNDLVDAITNGAEVAIIQHSTGGQDYLYIVDKLRVDPSGYVQVFLYTMEPIASNTDLVHKMIYLRTTGAVEAFYENNTEKSYTTYTMPVSWFVKR